MGTPWKQGFGCVSSPKVLSSSLHVDMRVTIRLPRYDLCDALIRIDGTNASPRMLVYLVIIRALSLSSD